MCLKAVQSFSVTVLFVDCCHLCSLGLYFHFHHMNPSVVSLCGSSVLPECACFPFILCVLDPVAVDPLSQT